jgi:hypothetical protein
MEISTNLAWDQDGVITREEFRDGLLSLLKLAMEETTTTATGDQGK